MPSRFPTKSGTILDQAHIYIDTQTGSAEENHRLTIRTKLAQALKTANHSEQTAPQDLTISPPQHEKLNISISHTQDASLFAWIEKPKKIGVDIELPERLQPVILARVSTKKEMAEVPDFKYLWPAKEAAFKALSHEIEVLSDIETHSWKQVDAQTWLYQVRLAKTAQSIDGLGAVCLTSRHLISFFILNR